MSSHKVFKYRQGDVKTLSPITGLVGVRQPCQAQNVDVFCSLYCFVRLLSVLNRESALQLVRNYATCVRADPDRAPWAMLHQGAVHLFICRWEQQYMQLGIIGLGRMGGNIARRLMLNGHTTVVFDRNTDFVSALEQEGATAVADLPALVAGLAKPRAVWVMLPSGAPTEDTIETLSELLDADDIIIDGGNTFYKDDIRRSQSLAEKGIQYVDVGTSGGVWGLERGYCMMIGGDSAVVKHLDPLFAALAPGMGDIPRTKDRVSDDDRAERGYIHAGPAGAGHFVKMVHNGIEYGLMQAYAEGFNLMKMKGGENLPEEQRFDLNLGDIAEVWRRGSVVSSWLLDLTADALATDEPLNGYSGAVADSGEGRWTIEAAMEQSTPVPVLSQALFARYSSRQQSLYGDKLLSAMRFGFGGHVETPKK